MRKGERQCVCVFVCVSKLHMEGEEVIYVESRSGASDGADDDDDDDGSESVRGRVIHVQKGKRSECVRPTKCNS